MARGTELHMYDFDGTLFRSPPRPSWWGRKSWALNYASLGPPCVPLIPGPEWWIEDTVRSARKSIRSPKTWAILCTARHDTPPLRFRIAELVKNKGLNFDEVYLSHVKNVTDREERSLKQATYKLNVMLRLLRRHPHIETVQIWEDHDEHLPWFVEKIEAAGTRCIPHFVVATSHKPLCTSPFEAEVNPGGQMAGRKRMKVYTLVGQRGFSARTVCTEDGCSIAQPRERTRYLEWVDDTLKKAGATPISKLPMAAKSKEPLQDPAPHYDAIPGSYKGKLDFYERALDYGQFHRPPWQKHTEPFWMGHLTPDDAWKTFVDRDGKRRATILGDYFTSIPQPLQPDLRYKFHDERRWPRFPKSVYSLYIAPAVHQRNRLPSSRSGRYVGDYTRGKASDIVGWHVNLAEGMGHDRKVIAEVVLPLGAPEFTLAEDLKRTAGLALHWAEKRMKGSWALAQANPVGMAVPKGVIPVRVGKGKLTHVYAPNRRGGILCESGSGRARKKQALYDSKAKFITCYRCEKLLRNRG